MSVTLGQVHAFIAPAVLARFTRTGKRLGLLQSTGITLDQELEDKLGMRLFEPHTRMLLLLACRRELSPPVRADRRLTPAAKASGDRLRGGCRDPEATAR